MKDPFSALEKRIIQKKSAIILGLDPNPDLFPESFSSDSNGAFLLCKSVVEAVHPYVIGIKIQMAYFEQWGAAGIAVVEALIAHAKSRDLWVMIDGKRGDIGSTARAYARSYLAPNASLSVDSCTINPLMGTDCISPFLEYAEKYDKTVFSLLHTSNPSSQEFIGQPASQRYLLGMIRPLENSQNLGFVVGATQKNALRSLRKKLPNAWFLCPGVGAQGADVADVIDAGSHKILIPISRGIMFSTRHTDFLESAIMSAKYFQEEYHQAAA